jgi:hypothetical protein
VVVFGAGETASLTWIQGGERTVDLSVISVKRIDGALVGEFNIKAQGNAEDYIAGIASAFSSSLNESVLAGPDGWVQPFNYDVTNPAGSGWQDAYHGILADRDLAETVLRTGNSAKVTMIWPDIGGDRVTIQSGNRFRAVDIPITDITRG